MGVFECCAVAFRVQQKDLTLTTEFDEIGHKNVEWLYSHRYSLLAMLLHSLGYASANENECHKHEVLLALAGVMGVSLADDLNYKTSVVLSDIGIFDKLKGDIIKSLGLDNVKHLFSLMDISRILPDVFMLMFYSKYNTGALNGVRVGTDTFIDFNEAVSSAYMRTNGVLTALLNQGVLTYTQYASYMSELNQCISRLTDDTSLNLYASQLLVTRPELERMGV